MKILQGKQFQDWHNVNLDRLKSSIDQINEMHKILASTMVYGASFDYVNGYAINTAGGVIYKGNSFVIPVQKIKAPKDGQYIYLKNIETGEIAVSANSTKLNLARYHNGTFDYSVRSSVFDMDVTEMTEASEGAIRFDSSKGVFAVYSGGEWLYEKRTSITYTSTRSFGIDSSYDISFNSVALSPSSFFAVLRYSSDVEALVLTSLYVGGVEKSTASTAVTTGSIVKLVADNAPTQLTEYKININPSAEIAVDSIICGFVVGD